LLVEYVSGGDPDLVMPPPGKGARLTAAEVATLRAWIDSGAPWPDTAASPDSGPRPSRPGADHWAFRPVRRPAVPAVARPDRVRNPIDAFVLAELDRSGVEPSPEADRTTLLRRLSLDLLGLPPAPGDVDAFLADAGPGAYERLVDRL